MMGCWSCDVHHPVHLYFSLVINPSNAPGKWGRHINYRNIQCTLLNLGYPTVPLLDMKPDVYMSQTGSA